MASSKNGSTPSPQPPGDSGRNNYKISIQVSATPNGDDDTEVYYKVQLLKLTLSLLLFLFNPSLPVSLICTSFAM